MAELRSLLKTGESIRLYAISVDNHADSKKLSEKIAADSKGVVSFPLLSDWDSRVIDSYGLRDPAYKGQGLEGIPRAAVYVIDKKGRVAWVRIEKNYRERPTNADIRAALEAVGKRENQ